jgi:cytochrome oxidase assembly protein ShyY1
MIFNNIRSPETFAFKPGRLLWFFVVFFLPLFISLGVWQLNRAEQKEQQIEDSQGPVLKADSVDWQTPPYYRDVRFSGNVKSDVVFLLDNKTHNGQFGYEVFAPLAVSDDYFLVSLGWVKGNADRSILPELRLPETLTNAVAVIRPSPTNPIFGVEANLQHSNDSNVWVVQSLTKPWLKQVLALPISGFLQLTETEMNGIGPSVWQPSVMSPAKHKGYALQWFSMAVALLGMFLYAGFKRQK